MSKVTRTLGFHMCRARVSLFVDNVAKAPLSDFLQAKGASALPCRPARLPGEQNILALQSEHGAFAELFTNRAEVAAGGLSQRSSLLQFTPSRGSGISAGCPITERK